LPLRGTPVDATPSGLSESGPAISGGTIENGFYVLRSGQYVPVIGRAFRERTSLFIDGDRYERATEDANGTVRIAGRVVRKSSKDVTFEVDCGPSGEAGSWEYGSADGTLMLSGYRYVRVFRRETP
jgi:hypothetical protein